MNTHKPISSNVRNRGKRALASYLSKLIYLLQNTQIRTIFKDPFDEDEELEELTPDEDGTITLTPGKNAKIPLGGMGKGQKIKIAQPGEKEGMPPPPQPPPPKIPPEPVAEWTDKMNMKIKLTKEDKDEKCNKFDKVFITNVPTDFV